MSDEGPNEHVSPASRALGPSPLPARSWNGSAGRLGRVAVAGALLVLSSVATGIVVIDRSPGLLDPFDVWIAGRAAARADARLAEAKRLRDEGRMEEAIGMLEGLAARLADVRPMERSWTTRRETLRALAGVLRDRHRVERSDRVYAELIDLLPRDAATALDWGGRLLGEPGRESDGLSLFRDWIDRVPTAAAVAGWRLHLALAEDDLPEALVAFEDLFRTRMALAASDPHWSVECLEPPRGGGVRLGSVSVEPGPAIVLDVAFDESGTRCALVSLTLPSGFAVRPGSIAVAEGDSLFRPVDPAPPVGGSGGDPQGPALSPVSVPLGEGLGDSTIRPRIRVEPVPWPPPRLAALLAEPTTVEHAREVLRAEAEMRALRRLDRLLATGEDRS